MGGAGIHHTVGWISRFDSRWMTLDSRGEGVHGALMFGGVQLVVRMSMRNPL